MPAKSTKYYLLLLLLPLAFVAFYFIRQEKSKPVYQLPHFGKKTYGAAKDTVYHRVPGFAFINQEGKTVTQAAVQGKVYVADYFFTTCRSICPLMSSQMERLARHFAGNREVMFLSHTVNPEEDSVSVLKAYALAHYAQPEQWLFLTGNKKDLYRLAREGYLLNAEEGDGGEDDFIHTQNFALVDKERHIRGFYDGTDSAEVNRLIVDINILLDEYRWKEKN